MYQPSPAPHGRARRAPSTSGGRKPPLVRPAPLPVVRRQVTACTRCDLYRRATQTVFGEGPSSARVVLIGEQPGNEEDLAGHPFVGPAGRLLDRVLAAAGLDRSQLYLTNIVKHFKWEPRGKRRIHATPSAGEVSACLPWFEAEVAAVAPEVIVCLGATATRALLGRSFRLSVERGRLDPTPPATVIMATVHPSAVLRAPDDESRRAAIRRFIGDLRHVARWLTSHPRTARVGVAT